MIVQGTVHNGVVVLQGNAALPEGAAVSVSYPAHGHAKSIGEKGRIQVPLVRCDQPGSVNLSGTRIAEVLDEEDASPRR